MIHLSTLLKHYKREDIQREIIDNAKDREVAIKFGDKGFGQRPDVLSNSNDIIELAKQGATSFHASEELWRNPLLLSPMMSRREMEDLRIGWDLVMDIDCPFLEYSTMAADLLIKALKYHNIKSISCKFSGNHGFHIGVPFEAFPAKVHDRETKLWFPDGAKAIAQYLATMIMPQLAKTMLEKESLDAIMKKTGKRFNEVVKKGVFEPFSILSIDTLLISSRHLYRMPYSFNEKSGLVSVPINPDKILEFRKEIAIPANVRVSKFRFLDRKNAEKDEAKKLIVQAFDFNKKTEEGVRKNAENYEDVKEAVPEQFFPPCINLILKGVTDGRKRSMFILVNFLSSLGWGYEQIEQKLEEWNKKNPEPLREVLIKGQTRYHKQQKKKVLPPNCANSMYYKDFRVCVPDNLCQKIKNPVNYSRIKIRYLEKEKKTSKKADAD